MSSNQKIEAEANPNPTNKNILELHSRDLPSANPQLTRSRFSGIKVVLSDLDGTLLDNHNEISTDNIVAIKALRASGRHFTFATGRLDTMTRIYIEQLEIEEPVVSCNGALIRTGLSHEIKHIAYMDPEDVHKLIPFLLAKSIDFLAYDDAMIYYPESSKRVRTFDTYNRMARRFNSRETMTCLYDFVRDLPALADKICKIYAYHEEPGRMDCLRRFLETETQLVGASSRQNNLDIAPAGQTKGNAVHWLAEYYGVTTDAICVFGDNDNDVSMMKEAGLGIGMRNGSALCRKHADLLAEANQVSGVGRAIRQYILD